MEDCVLQPHGFYEWEQKHFTCKASDALARLDRIYVNQHVSVQLDHQCKAYVHNWCHDVSTHRPVGFARTHHGDHRATEHPMQPWAFKHEGFAGRAEVEFKYRLQNSNTVSNPISRLLLLKDSIKFVHDNIVKEGQKVEADNVPDQLAWALVYIRALETRNFARAAQATECFPKLASCGRASRCACLALSESGLGDCIQAVRELVIDLARQDINSDLQNLRSISLDADDGGLSIAKYFVLRKLERLSPGEASTIGCVVDDGGQHHVEPQAMAQALCKHWQHVFGPSACDTSRLHAWFSRLFPEVAPGVWDTGVLDGANPKWHVTHKHVKKAIQLAKNTMPGPDGVPALAYKALGDLAIDALFDVFEALSSEDAEAELAAAYAHCSAEEAHSFNLSLLCLLPKTPTGFDDEHGTYFHAGDTRPLSISNVDSRLLASAARLAWEPILESWISQSQRGFLKGRSMIHNILDVDWHAMTVSLKAPKDALLLFDFKAAFPSVSHAFLLRCLHALGLPKGVMNFIGSMYSHNRCVIRMQGQDYPGFCLQGGVRQGCPLSPLLFAVSVDILLRTIVHELPGCVCRAFADDIAAVTTD